MNILKDLSIPKHLSQIECGTVIYHNQAVLEVKEDFLKLYIHVKK